MTVKSNFFLTLPVPDQPNNSIRVMNQSLKNDPELGYDQKELFCKAQNLCNFVFVYIVFLE